MSNFPSPGEANSSTGFVVGSNQVSCPLACRLTTGAPIFNSSDANRGRNNTYQVSSIPSYYCIINSGPPIPHTQLPDNYQQNAYYITPPSDQGWGVGEVVSPISLDEPYTAPRSNFMFNAFNSTVACQNTPPPLAPPTLPHPPPPHPCHRLQNSLNWFRINN